MNAEQKSPDEGNKVIDFAKAQLGKEVQKNSIEATAKVAAAGVRKLKTLGPIQNQNDVLRAMTPEDRANFLDQLARRTVDQEWWRSTYNKLRLLIPGNAPLVFWEMAKDGTLAGMLMLGMIGDRETQEAFALRAQPGVAETWIAKLLPWIAKLDLEPSTREALEFIAVILKAKKLTLDTLGRIRELVETGTDEEALNAALGEALGGVQDAANYTALMPADPDHKEPTELHLDQAMGPLTKEELDREINKAFGPNETPEA